MWPTNVPKVPGERPLSLLSLLLPLLSSMFLLFALWLQADRICEVSLFQATSQENTSAASSGASGANTSEQV